MLGAGEQYCIASCPIRKGKMARRVHGTGGAVRSSTRYVPHLVMILAQLCFALMSFITEAAMDMELNSYVYVTYRHLLVALLI